MHVRIRQLTASTKENDLFLDISKTAPIEELKKMIESKLKIKSETQRLYYQGKELISDHTVTDYNIRLNDVIQLLIKSDKEESSDKIADESSSKSLKRRSEDNLVATESRYYKAGDLIDVIDDDLGAWFEARILEVLAPPNSSNDENSFVFKIRMDSLRNEETAPIQVKLGDIRPRSFHVFDISDLQPDMVALANYNIEDPKERGYWYDFKVTEVTRKVLKGTVLVGKTHTPLDDCTIKFGNEVMRIENSVLMSERSEAPKEIPPRKLPFYCKKCKDVPTKNCRECGCFICAKKHNASTLILCDECDKAFHISCLDPPLEEIPADPEWYCPDCKTDENEIVKAGEKLKLSKKKMKMASNKAKENGNNRDWGKGMACVGRTKECTIVPKDHYGPVPGVEVGTCWKFRVQVSEAGIHRPHVAGIHGRETDGSYSLVLSGGYEDDIDNGEEFYYTGSGGRDLSGNKRVNEQSCDQKLTRMNKALALNCNTRFDDKAGGEAKDWKKGKPVRVVRNYKLGKHSKYAPEDGNRYDGIYKVVKYYPEKGKSGFIVWRYLLRRDDPTPAPWAKGGQEFDMIYPPGHLEALQAKEDAQLKEKKTTKRKNTSNGSITNYFSSPKRQKRQDFKLTAAIEKLIDEDSDNDKLWNECKEVLKEGKQKFLNKVEELFVCVCCQEVVYEPITTACKHNVCKSCLKRSFSSEIFSCPNCRFELGKDYAMVVNDNLGNILKDLFPGYESGR